MRYCDGECVLQKGDPVLYVHIPANGRLSPELADESFELAKEFFPKYFPEHNYKAFVCSSWLLDENLKKFLIPNSNIIAFQNRFTIAETKENNFSLYWHIFNIEDFLPPQKLVPKNNFLKEFSSAGDNDRVLRAATKVEEVVFVTFCTTACYLGTDCLTRRTESVINALVSSDKLAAIVHFGNPFALNPLKHIPRKILGYNIPDSQKYAIEVLAGKLEPKGKLPLNIEYK